VPELRGAREIFLTFTRIGASGFGGVNFWIRRVLVQESAGSPTANTSKVSRSARSSPGRTSTT